MRNFTTCILMLVLSVTLSAQEEVFRVTWDDLKVEEFTKSYSEELNTYVSEPVFSDVQTQMDSLKVIISGNYHILNSFDSKTHLISRDEIIKTPMQRDEIMLVSFKDESQINFGRKVKIQGTLILSKSLEDESLYTLIDAERIK